MDIGNDLFLQESTIAQYTAHLTNIVNACKTSGDVLLMTGFPYGLPLPSRITASQYQAAVLAVASSTKSPIWDTLTTWGGYGASQNGWSKMGMNAGWNASCCGGLADKAHWSVASNVYLATMISVMLLQ
jgi:hypothetical protein